MPVQQAMKRKLSYMLTLTWLIAAGSTSTRQTAVWPTAGSMCTVRTSAIIRKNIIKPHLYYFHRRGSAGEGMAIGHPLPFIDSDALCFQYPWRGGNLAAVPAPSPASVLLHNVDSGCQNREMRECRRNAPHIVLRHVRRDGYEYACASECNLLSDVIPEGGRPEGHQPPF